MNGLLTLLFFALWFYIMMRWGCGAHMIHGSHGASGHHNDLINHKDPVCGMEVEPDKGYGKMYKGRTYCFCSRSCLDKFDHEPERYLNQREAQS